MMGFGLRMGRAALGMALSSSSGAPEPFDGQEVEILDAPSTVAAGNAATVGAGGSFPISAGANRLLVVCLQNQAAGAQEHSGMAFGDQAMSELRQYQIGGFEQRGSIWILGEAGIAAATGDEIVPTIAGTIDIGSITAMVLQHVNQAAPIKSSASATVEGPNDVSLSMAGVDGGLAVAFATCALIDTIAWSGLTLAGTQEDVTVGGSQNSFSQAAAALTSNGLVIIGASVEDNPDRFIMGALVTSPAPA